MHLKTFASFLLLIQVWLLDGSFVDNQNIYVPNFYNEDTNTSTTLTSINISSMTSNVFVLAAGQGNVHFLFFIMHVILFCLCGK